MTSERQLRLRAIALAMTKPLKIFQDGRLVGTIPLWPPRSTSGMFTIRERDFRLASRDGEQVIEADRMICPGDFHCLQGFRDALGAECQPDAAAREFDMHVEGGASRLDAMESTIENMLNRKVER